MNSVAMLDQFAVLELNSMWRGEFGSDFMRWQDTHLNPERDELKGVSESDQRYRSSRNEAEPSQRIQLNKEERDGPRAEQKRRPQ